MKRFLRIMKYISGFMVVEATFGLMFLKLLLKLGIYEI